MRYILLAITFAIGTAFISADNPSTLQEIVKEVMNAMFLLSLEELAFKYYVDKVCLSLLSSVQCVSSSATKIV